MIKVKKKFKFEQNIQFMKKFFFIIALIFSSLLFSQNDLLQQISTDSVANYAITDAFKAVKIVNLESTKLVGKNEYYLVIAHRFGSIKGGIDDFFGLDNAVTQIKVIYGLTNKIAISAGRSEQAYDFGLKQLLTSQKENGFPASVVLFNSLSFNNTLKPSNFPKMKFATRMAFVNQILISRKFNKSLSLQLAPTHFHENFVLNDNQKNSQFAFAMGGRLKVSKRISINSDYALHVNRASSSQFKNPLSIGVDIETGGHVFQMHFTNSQGIHEAGFLGNTNGSWSNGNVFFGFNLVRVF